MTTDFYSNDITNKSLIQLVRMGDLRAHRTLEMRADRGGYRAKEIIAEIGRAPTTTAMPKPSPAKEKIKLPATLPKLRSWQREALLRWWRNGQRGIVEAVTGAGKTVLGLAAASTELDRGGRVIVVVPSIILLNQWTDRLREAFHGVSVGRIGGGFSAEPSRHDIVVAVVNSAADAVFPTKKGQGLLIGDECHRYGAPTFAKALKADFPRRLGLSATYERMDDAHVTVLIPYFGTVVFSLDYKRAIAEEAVSRFDVIFKGVALRPAEMLLYQQNSDIAKDARGLLIGKHGVTPDPFGAFIQEVNELSEGGGDARATMQARRYLGAFSKKRQVLAESSAKIEAMDDLMPLIARASGTIVFTETVEASEKIAARIDRLGVLSEAIHSKLGSDRRAAVLERFRARRTQVIVAPKVLDEGVDVPDADLGIIVSASSSERQMIQRMGRVLRIAPGKQKATFVVVYARGTTEDPQLGAHETFIEAIRDVADSERYV